MMTKTPQNLRARFYSVRNDAAGIGSQKSKDVGLYGAFLIFANAIPTRLCAAWSGISSRSLFRPFRDPRHQARLERRGAGAVRSCHGSVRRQSSSLAHHTAPGRCSLWATAKCRADSLSAKSPPTRRCLSQTIQHPSRFRPTRKRVHVLKRSWLLRGYRMIFAFSSWQAQAWRMQHCLMKSRLLRSAS